MNTFREGEVWFVGFPLEEDNSQIINRPVVILDQDNLGVLSVKITKHIVRSDDPYDFIFKIGNLHPDDLNKIEELYIHFMDGTLPQNKTH